MKALILLIGIMAMGLCSFAQLNLDEVSFRNDLKNTVVSELNKARAHYGVRPVILADKYSQDSDEAVAILYTSFSAKDRITDSDYIDVLNDIQYKGQFPSGGNGLYNTILFFNNENEIPKYLRLNLRRREGSALTKPEVRLVSISILEDEYGQIYMAIMSYN